MNALKKRPTLDTCEKIPSPMEKSRVPDFLAYISIARPDHWFKNIFVLPGIILGIFFYPQQLDGLTVAHVLLCLVATCLVASSNYVINEILDAPTDVHHPLKKIRPIPSGRVYLPAAYAEWLVLAILGLSLAFSLSVYLGWACTSLWVMGMLYNIPPIRLKDLPFLDVLSESINNPIRLCIGWYITGLKSAPPVSALISYWMLGAFLMAVKRFGEYRGINNATDAENYRKSFRYYDERRLLLSIFFYSSLFSMFSAVFMSRYRFELLLAAPIIAYVMSYYLSLGFQRNSPVQRPENLYREVKLLAAVAVNVIAISILFFVDFPLLKEAFYPWHTPPHK